MSDILWRDTSGDVAIWLMNGTQVSSAAGLGQVATTWTIIGTGDYNGNRYSDILWQDTSGDIEIWFMNGLQIASSAYVGKAPNTSWTIKAPMPTEAAAG